MKKRNIVIILSSLLSLLAVPSLCNNNSTPEYEKEVNQNLDYAANVDTLSENTKKVISFIQVLEGKQIDYSFYEYIQEIWYAYHTLNATEKADLGEYYDILVNASNTANKAKAAYEFDVEFNYLLNDGTFAYQKKLEELKNKYETFDNETKAFVESYTSENENKIKENAEALTPDIYYDFSTAVKDGSYLVNQGTLENKDAKLLGSANVDNGYLSFGSNSSSDSSCLELPTDMFKDSKDFTFSVEYEKTANVGDNEMVFTFGTNEFHDGTTTNRMGFRVQYSSWHNRGPFYMFAYKGDMSKEFGHGPQMTPADDTLHTFRFTVRYLSRAKALQVHCKNLTTNVESYVNYALNGTNFSSNNYVELDASNFDFSSFKAYLGARNGYSNGHKSFQGKYLSFSYYSSLVTEREMYGFDDRKVNVGAAKETLEYINNFGPVGASFAEYKELYAPLINKHYKIYISCPYDYQKFFDNEHLEYFLEAYRIVNL